MATSLFLKTLMTLSERERSEIIRDLISMVLEKTKADKSSGRSGTIELRLDDRIVDAPISIALFDRAVARRLVRALGNGASGDRHGKFT